MIRLVARPLAPKKKIFRSSQVHNNVFIAVGTTKTQVRQAHTVRVIYTKDLPNGKGYAGEVRTVRAGYARNHLVPLKKALYATPNNFERVGIADPDELSQEEERRAKEVGVMEQDSEDTKAADFLKYYLRNKTLKIWRNVESNVDRSSSGVDGVPIHPGVVDATVVRDKLSKQLKIDLEDHEHVQLNGEAISHSLFDEDIPLIEKTLNAMQKLKVEEGEKCNVKIKTIGEYLCKLHLKGNQTVGLRVAVKKR